MSANPRFVSGRLQHSVHGPVDGALSLNRAFRLRADLAGSDFANPFGEGSLKSIRLSF
jgi:hypothetical protein